MRDDLATTSHEVGENELVVVKVPPRNTREQEMIGGMLRRSNPDRKVLFVPEDAEVHSVPLGGVMVVRLPREASEQDVRQTIQATTSLLPDEKIAVLKDGEGVRFESWTEEGYREATGPGPQA